MRYKEDNDNRYRVNFMRATEELMDALTVESFISYLEENAEFEDYTVEYIDGKCVKCRAYDLTEENSKLHKEFLVTEDGRVFYWRTLLDKIELVDDEIPEGMVEGLQEGDTYRNFNAIWVVDKIYTVDDPTLWYEAVVPYYFLVWYNRRRSICFGTAAVVPYYFLVWYNQEV